MKAGLLVPDRLPVRSQCVKHGPVLRSLLSLKGTVFLFRVVVFLNLNLI